ncbi:NUDIX hydrolase [Marinomonas piezotolerans]|uniref:NUDIX hydrolase n=1 Tax=Marinomonas piezotolerans TaxID=2213058 RepID=A0A370U5K0_9GAMM|nr:NUDIX domain-containing protein [Marinomonas piezotolerans]RDL43042.1 NUDIX hydrolase [Marinomonas piezotolerans]
MIKEIQDGQVVLNQPAGHVENGETLQQAVVRESLEESGWQVLPRSILGIYAFTPFQEADTYHRVCFICTPSHKQSDVLDADIIESVWLTKDQISALPQRSPLIMQCIQDFEAGQAAPLEIIENMHISPKLQT